MLSSDNILVNYLHKNLFRQRVKHNNYGSDLLPSVKVASKTISLVKPVSCKENNKYEKQYRNWTE